MTALLETLFPTVGDVISALVLLAMAVAILWAAVTGALELDLLDDRVEPEPESPIREPRSLVRVLDPAPFDWQHEADL